MLPRRYIDEWREFAPWPEDAQVEQDLVIEKALLQLYMDPFLQQRLAFRGGTAIHKLFLRPPVRYSEDIDLVQIKSEPIKHTLTAIRKQLDFLGIPSVKQKENNNTLVFRFESEIPPVINLRLKIEINCREHFSVLGYQEFDYSIQNSWTNGFSKLKLDSDKIVKCYRNYMEFATGKPPTKKQFLLNMEEKLQDPDFEGDIYGLLRPGLEYDQGKAYNLIKTELIEKI